MKGSIDAKYAWTEHVSPKAKTDVRYGDTSPAQIPQVEEFVSQEAKKVNPAEGQKMYAPSSSKFANQDSDNAVSKKSIVDSGKEKDNRTDIDAAGNGEALIAIMADIENNELKLKMHYLTPEAAAEKVIEKMVDISTLTKKQSEYISYNSHKYATELKRLIAQQTEEKAQALATLKELQQERASKQGEFQNIIEQYQEEKAQAIAKLTEEQEAHFKTVTELKYLRNQHNDEKNQLVAQLNAQQQERDGLEEAYKICLHRVEKLESILRNKGDSTDMLEAKTQKFAKQVEKLESILRSEQVLRKQAEERTKEILAKAKKIKSINESERKQREIAEQQAERAVERAREVMSYFFNSAFSDDSVSKHSATNFINKNFPEFDSVMMNKKLPY